ncbi:MAG: protein phosphatase CheZ [Nitrospirae bacterium]|nr:protein phosphatase CheZ [Nitrospirota bacterium]
MQVQKQFDNVIQLVGFTVGNDRFAVDISDVHEINRFEQINRIPDLPEHVLGVIDLRGTVIPVINLAGKLGIQGRDVTKDTRIIIVGFNGEKIGILVDAVSEVLRISDNSLEMPPSIMQSFNSEYIRGIIRHNGQLTVVMDLPRLFKDYGLQGFVPDNEINSSAEGNSIAAPAADKDAVIDKIAEVTKAMSEGDFHQEISGELYGQLGEIAKYINATIKKLQLVEPNVAQASERIPQASVQLSEITRATEEATHNVMSQVEHVLDNQDMILRHIEVVEKGNDVSTTMGEIRQIVSENKETLLDIITGLSFQDLTGQKIKAIVGLIEEVEKRLLQLIVAFGMKSKEVGQEDNPLKEFTENPVLNQDVVDSVLKEFGFE